jgi:hypothetical protein
VRSLDVSRWNCHHRAIRSADPWPDDMPVPTFGPRMVYTRCGIIGVDARPNVSLLQCSTPLPRWANKRLMHRSKRPPYSITNPAM